MPQPTWRFIGAIALVLGLASLIITTPPQWVLAAGAENPAALVAAHSNVWTAMGLVAVLGPAVWIIGILAVTTSVQGRGWLFTMIGGLITAVALACGVGHLAIYFSLPGDLARADLPEAAVRAVMSADDADPISTALLLAFLAGFTVGPVLLCVGLRRAALVPVWLPVVAVIAGVANFAGGPIAGSIQLVMLAATYLPMARILSRTDRGGSTDSRSAAPVRAAV